MRVFSANASSLRCIRYYWLRGCVNCPSVLLWLAGFAMLPLYIYGFIRRRTALKSCCFVYIGLAFASGFIVRVSTARPHDGHAQQMDMETL